MTILVTGSAGHLGEALMRTLRMAERSARGIDIKDSPFTDRRGSICDRTFIRECMQGIRTVLHLATLHKPHVATHSNQEFIDSGTCSIASAAARISEAHWRTTSAARGITPRRSKGRRIRPADLALPAPQPAC